MLTLFGRRYARNKDEVKAAESALEQCGITVTYMR